MNDNTTTINGARTLRRDLWWVEPLAIFLYLAAFVIYATWAALQNQYYYVDPYLSPFYSPCIAANCTYLHLPLIGSWWSISPAILILWMPGGFRVTCYYYRKAYYRSYFASPPACGVRDAARRYTGETRFPFILQNAHRYFFWLATLVLLFLWWDAYEAFRFPDGIGVGIGTLVLLVNAVLLSFYSFSCHSCRHMCGGYLDSFSKSPARYGMWHIVSRLNEHHMLFAWISLTWVALTDLYVRLVAMGVIHDIRLI